MNSLPRRRLAAMTTLGLAALAAPYATASLAQEDASPKAVLLGRARTLEGRGRLDLAKGDWLQVLVLDPKDAEALAGMVRASRAEAHNADADIYAARLRAVRPTPATAEVAPARPAHDANVDLAEAARLAHAGDAAGAMVLYRRVYGATPPEGQPALLYYEAEAATVDGRPHAVAGLRALADRFPSDTRYQIVLGRVLLSSARTRAEGRTLLERFPGNAEATAALHGTPSGTLQATNSGAASGAGAAPRAATPEQPKKAAPTPPQNVAPAQAAVSAPPPTTHPAVHVQRTASTAEPMQGTAEQGGAGSGASAGSHLALAVDEQAAFTALNAHRMAEAEQRFNAILAKDPGDARALAGMGYLRVTSGDLKAAVGYFQRAQENGDHSLALTRAMISAQFEFSLRMASAERSKGNLGGAEARYREALRERPSDPEALDGLAQTLLGQNRAAEAATVYRRLTEVRPMSPAAWRGLVVAQADSGKGAAALATDAHLPAAVKGPLLQDATYQITLASVRGTQTTQRARVDRPSPLPPAAPQPRPAAVPKAPSVAAISKPPLTPSTAVPSQPVVAKVAPPPSRNEVNPHGATAASATETARLKGAPRAPSSSAASAPATVVASAPQPVVAAPPLAAAENETIANERLQQADLALMHGANAEATTLFHDVLSRTPGRPEAWRGLVMAQQRNGREHEAALTLERMPAPVRLALGRDASFQSAAGALYLATNQPREALGALVRAQEVFATQRLSPPLELVLQTARLLSARADDDNLYRELMYLGERRDLNDAQRAQVQMIWTQWAVRRARALSVAGEDKRAVVLLNAAATAFAGNGEVLRAVADGYAGIGKPREAVALYKTQDFTNAPAAVLEAAVEVATAAHDFRTAENWAHLGLSRFTQDPAMLTAAAELAQARGHEKRAVALSMQAKANAPAQDPGQVLAAELREAKAGSGWMQPPTAGGQLSILLAPSDPAVVASGTSGRPYLPGSTAVGNTATAANAAPVLAGYDQPSL